jgi:cardiolipin synthase
MMIEFIPENHIILLRNGTEYFPRLVEDIEKAQQEIFLESYIFVEDTIGQQVAAALRSAAQRGVRVHLLLDGFGSRALAPELITSLKLTGVRVLFFRPDVAKFSLQKQRLRRMHRKVAVFDNKVAYVGGINILEDAELSFLPPRYDYAIRVEGGLVLRIHAAADHLWRHTCRVQLRLEWAKRSKVKPALPESPGEIIAGLAIRDNFRNRHTIENAYLRAIAEAKEEIVIANAYFLPAKRFREALIIAARRGVKVHILVQGRIDHFIQYFATRTLYERFIKAGVSVYEYTLGFMHAKVAVIDQNWSTVGSSNIDPFSLLLAREANIFIKNAVFSGQLRDDIMQAIKKDAIQIQLADLKTQPWLLRVVSNICYQLMRGVMGLVGYGKQEYD